MRKKVYGFLAVMALIIALATFVGGYFGAGSGASAHSDQEQSQTKTDEEEVVPVRLAGVEKGDISSFISATANLRPFREVEVVNRVDGRVTDLLVEEGAFVGSGQLLAKLDDTELQIRFQTAQQQLAQARLQSEKASIRRDKARTQIENTREEYQRYKQLYDEKLVSEREVAQLGYQVEELEHDERISDSETRELRHRVDELSSEIEQVRLQISQTEVRAPFAGRITERKIEAGQTVRALEALFSLADFTPLQTNVFLSEREALQVRPGQQTSVVLGVDESIRIAGRVARISPVVDQATGTVKVTVEVNAGAGSAFKPGAFVRIEIRTDTRNETLLIPKRAVLEEDGQDYVFVSQGDQASRVPVKLGYSSPGQVEVLEGLSEGDQVVIAGQGALKDNAKIQVIS